MANKAAQQKREGMQYIPDVFWERLKPLLPAYKQTKKGGRPRSDLRNIVNGILYVLRTGCQWKMVPKEYGTGSTCHRYFQEWEKKGVFRQIWQLMVVEYDEKKG